MKKVVTRVTRCKMHQILTESWNFAWLLVDCSLLVSTLLLMRYPIKEDTDLESNSGILPERRYFFLHLWSICQMFIGLLFNKSHA